MNFICAIAKNEQDYIDEWIQYHLNLGFDQIHVFDNNATDGLELSEQLKPYSGKVFVHSWARGLYAPQIHCYTTFHRNFCQQFKWCAYIDIDEFITIPKELNIAQYIEKTAGDHQAILLNWKIFGDNGFTYKTDGTVQERFVTPAESANMPTAPNANYHVKSIIRSDVNVQFKTPHIVKNVYSCNGAGRTVASNTPFSTPDFSSGYIRHYFTKSTEEYFNKKWIRGRGDIGQWGLQDAINMYFATNPPREDSLNFVEQLKQRI